MSVSRVRPTTIAELRERQKPMLTEEGLRRALAFQPHPTDVIITPYQTQLVVRCHPTLRRRAGEEILHAGPGKS